MSESGGYQRRIERLVRALADTRGQLEMTERALAVNSDEVNRLRGVLEMYADPASYHAIGFWFDRPCGEFADDFSEDHGDTFYDRAMPGARARAALLGTIETTEETTT